MIIHGLIDENQLKTGVRADGAIYSFTSLITKIVSALVGALSATVLGAIDYVAHAKQTPEVVDGINMLVNLGPGILLLLGTIPLYFYHITKTRAMQTSEQLVKRQNELFCLV
ncbi:MFS transporter [Metabacillus rhizolycopersici]|uniref:MFS transporter n=1 Tax=Metabacillus rhizolycopersici TaxID=2875709 RepID=A0ABS7UMW3_9BACI|nr:MFS transporter [Metabacillus rhizolycopersici]MBZ5749646.1 MFS transporter [Metabacillus rhizolycopersici]